MAPDAAEFAPPVARPGVAAGYRRGADVGAGPSGGNRCKQRLQRVPGGPAHGLIVEPPSRPDRLPHGSGRMVLEIFSPLGLPLYRAGCRGRRNTGPAFAGLLHITLRYTKLIPCNMV